jgi:hypothetical protein
VLRIAGDARTGKTSLGCGRVRKLDDARETTEAVSLEAVLNRRE